MNNSPPKENVLNILAVLVTLFVGCAIITDSIYEGIVQKPSSQWNIEECRIVIGRSLAHNAKVEDAPIHVFAIPFTPLTITALNREDQLKKHWTDEDYQANIQQQARECLGMFVDWQTDTYLDAQGRLFQDAAQMDSVLFLITFDNISGSIPFINISTPAGSFMTKNWFGPLLDLGDFAYRVFLENSSGERIPPRLVWMRKRVLVSKAESMLAMFDLRREGKHFLEGSDGAQIVVTGFTKDVRLSYRLALGQFQAMNWH